MPWLGEEDRKSMVFIFLRDEDHSNPQPFLEFKPGIFHAESWSEEMRSDV